MMRLVALRQIKSGCGSIEPETSFVADEREGARLIEAGDAILETKYGHAYTGSGYWYVQPEWQGATVAILAGGPSLTQDQVDALGLSDEAIKIIAINNAASIAPSADILYFCDDRWYEWNKDLVRRFDGMRVTLENIVLQKQIEVRCLRDYGTTGFAPRRDGVTNGRNSGYQALHLAALLGASRVILLGYDMRVVNGQMHWHDEHRVATPANIFEGWLNCYETLAPELTKRGVEVINCSPDSALLVFPRMSLAEALPHARKPEPLYAPLRIDIPPAVEPEPEEAFSIPESRIEDPPPLETATPEPAHKAGFLLPEDSRELSGLKDMLSLQAESGRDGKDGKDGRDGVDGKDGAPGKDGVDGKDAPDANGLKLASQEAREAVRPFDHIFGPKAGNDDV